MCVFMMVCLLFVLRVLVLSISCVVDAMVVVCHVIGI